MKKTDLKEKSSVFIIGRGFIIAAIFITSSLSFTLGYFVGKSGQSRVENQLFPSARQERAEQKIVPENKEATTQQLEQSQKTPQPETLQTQQTQENTLIKETAETKKTQETTKTPENKETVTPQEKTKTSQKIKYTVQAGAFTNSSEAESLKAKLDKKGYKAYVIQSETKRNKKLYKVRIGEFGTKKEAELLSKKIRKTEGLQTFATFKTTQEDVR